MINIWLFRTKMPLWLRYITHLYQLVIRRFPIHYNANMTGRLVFLCMFCLVVIKLVCTFFVLASSYNLGCYAAQFCDCVMVKNMPLFRTKMPLETRLSSCLYLLLARATWVLYMAFYDGRLVFLCILCLVIIKLVCTLFVIGSSYNLDYYSARFCGCRVMYYIPLFCTKRHSITRFIGCRYLLLARPTWIAYTAFYDGRLVFLCNRSVIPLEFCLNISNNY